MKEKEAVVVNEYGIHCRPSGVIVKEMCAFPGCRFFMDKGDGFVDVSRDMMAVISMGLEKGTKVVVRAEGEGEEEACEKIAGLIGYNFDFER